jgi:biotin synthase
MGEIMAGAELARRAGVRTLVLRSGDDPSYPAEALAEVVRGLSSRFGFDLVLALGERKAPVYAMWREAGARGYWLRHETCDPFLYRRIRPSMFGVDRMRSLKAAAESGLALASGIIIGMPNQTYESLVEDLMSFSDQDPDRSWFGLDLEAFWPPPRSVGSELIKHPEHVIVEADQITIEKALAVSRLLRPDIVIPLSNPIVQRFFALTDGRLFRAGANGLLLDFTPVKDDQYEKSILSGLPVRGLSDLAAIKSSLAELGLTLSLDRPIVPNS